jgi:hypothetical protein
VVDEALTKELVRDLEPPLVDDLVEHPLQARLAVCHVPVSFRSRVHLPVALPSPARASPDHPVLAVLNRGTSD